MTLPQKQQQQHGDIIESVIAKGDLSRLTVDERNIYYREVCRSVGLNPLTQPFAYITLNGKLTLYAKRDAADQLRKNNGISIEIVSQDASDGLLTVHVRAKDKSGRLDEDLGVVSFPETLKGEARANAILKAVTKAKRRVTLSISGLGFLDETEVEDIPGTKKPAMPAANVMLEPPSHDPRTGEITDPRPPAETPAPSRANPPAIEMSAGVLFFVQTREHIRAATDYQSLGQWWNSEEQLKFRNNLLDNEQRKDLREFVMTRIAQLKNEEKQDGKSCTGDN